MKSKHGFVTSLARSELMKKIKGKNTTPEITLRKTLWQLGYRYRINVASLPGKPDIVLNKYELIIFVDGEFWHGYNWEDKKKKIKANRQYWIKKIERNMERDQINTQKLIERGYTVLRFWEHEIKADVMGCVNTIIKACDNNINSPSRKTPGINIHA